MVLKDRSDIKDRYGSVWIGSLKLFSKKTRILTLFCLYLSINLKREIMTKYKTKTPMPAQLTALQSELTRMRNAGAAPIAIKELTRKYNRLMSKWIDTL